MSFMGMRAAFQGLLRRLQSASKATGSPRAAADEVVESRTDAVSVDSMLAGLRANLEHNRHTLSRDPQRQTVERLVDNRVFLLGLDELYRTGMKAHERTELLEATRK